MQESRKPLGGPPFNRYPILRSPTPHCKTVPSWTSLAGLAGPLTGVILSRTPQWTAPVGFERQLTFRPYQGIISVHWIRALFKIQQDAVRWLKADSRGPSWMFQMTSLGQPACVENGNRWPNKRVISNSSQVLLWFSSRICLLLSSFFSTFK